MESNYIDEKPTETQIQQIRDISKGLHKLGLSSDAILKWFKGGQSDDFYMGMLAGAKGFLAALPHAVTDTERQVLVDIQAAIIKQMAFSQENEEEI